MNLGSSDINVASGLLCRGLLWTAGSLVGRFDVVVWRGLFGSPLDRKTLFCTTGLHPATRTSRKRTRSHYTTDSGCCHGFGKQNPLQPFYIRQKATRSLLSSSLYHLRAGLLCPDHRTCSRQVSTLKQSSFHYAILSFNRV